MKELNRNGFTLIELLVVIAILSLVVSISMYFITGILSNAKEKTYMTSINEVETAAGNYLLENSDMIYFIKKGDIEYQCVTVKELIDYGFLNNDVTKAQIDKDGNTININNYVYIERNIKSRSVQTKKYLLNSELNNICGVSTLANGNIYFSVSPNGWSKSKIVKINYSIKNAVNKSDYKYGYEYRNNNNNIIIDYQNTSTNSENVSVNEKGNMYADIIFIGSDEEQIVTSKNINVSLFDKDGPNIKLVNNNSENIYVSNSVTIPLSIKDCEDENCSGLKEYTNSELTNIISTGKIVVKIDDKVLNDGITLTKSSNSVYNLTINNAVNNGNISIEILENTFIDTVIDEEKNGNEHTILDPKIIFDNTKPTIQISSSETLNSTSQTIEFTCSDDNSIGGYYVGNVDPNNNTVYELVDNKEQIIENTLVNEAGTYYVSCKDTAGNVITDSIKYWNYTLKYMLNSIDKNEGIYSINNYDSVKDESKYLLSDGSIIDFNNMNKVAPNGSNNNKFMGTSLGIPDTNEANISSENRTITSNSTYTLWYNRNTITIKYNANGGEMNDPHNNSYSLNEDGYVLYNGIINFTVYKYGTIIDKPGLLNWNNKYHLNLKKTGYSAVYGKEWKNNNNEKEFDQDSSINTNDICDASYNDCEGTLYVNWETSVVTLRYHANGSVFANKHGKGYTLDSNNDLILYNGSSDFHVVKYGESTDDDGLYNYNNQNYINLVKEHYTPLSGGEWNTKPNGSGTSYSQAGALSSQQLCSTISNGSCVVDLYANWKINTVTIRYHSNGAVLAQTHGAGYSIDTSSDLILYNGSSDFHKIEYGKSDDLYNYNNKGAVNIVRTGYHIVSGGEWKDNSGTIYNQQTNLSAVEWCSTVANGNCIIDLYANWEINTVTIRYHSNGAVLAQTHGAGYSIDTSNDLILYNGSSDFHKIEYGKSDDLYNYNNKGAVNIVRTGYSITNGSEWIIKSTNRIFDQNFAYSASDLCSTIANGSCVIDLSANWKPNCTVKFYPNGGTWSLGNPYSKTYTGAFYFSSLGSEPKRSGRSFLGWYSTKSGRLFKSYVDQNDCGDELYASWSQNCTCTTNSDCSPPDNDSSYRTKCDGGKCYWTKETGPFVNWDSCD